MLLGNVNPINIIGPKIPIAIPNIFEGIDVGNLCCFPNFDTQVQNIFPTWNATLLSMILATLATQKYTPKTKPGFKEEYDYIIVGAGAAGSALAARLSEKGCQSVLVAEAGGPPPILSEVPGIARALLMTDVNWNYLTEPQKATAAGIPQRKMPFPSGKGLGGSSIVNAMLSIRGNHRDYDDWEVEGWAWNDVFPYFKKGEDNIDPDIANNGLHGVGGPVTVSRVRYTPEVKPSILQAVGDFGYPYVDPNGASQLGYSDYQATIRNGQRCSAAKAYLVPADKRPNLDIVANAYATKVQIENKRATGVFFQFNGRRQFVRVRKEVIISAGTVETPKLLMLSGIGPKETLDKFKIPVIADLPVGQNFQDHTCGLLPFVVKGPAVPYTLKILDPLRLMEYAAYRSGPLASTEAVMNLAFFRSNDSATPETVPNFQLYYLEGIPLIARLTVGLRPEVYRQVFGPYEFVSSLWCGSSTLHPKSKGYVSIRSADPFEPPIIDPKFLEDPQDMKDIIAGMLRCWEMGTSAALKRFGVEPYATTFPGCEHLTQNKTALFECYVKSFTFTLNHQVGTAKMGKTDDPTAVTDPKLRVKGIDGLRVVDASIMPKVISGNTYTATMMIAEKAADIIKETITEC